MKILTIKADGLTGVRAETAKRVHFAAGDSYELLSEHPARNDRALFVLHDPSVSFVPDPGTGVKEPMTIRALLPQDAVEITEV